MRAPCCRWRIRCTSSISSAMRRKVEIALEQRRHRSESRISGGEQRPGLVVDRRAVGVDPEIGGLRMVPRNVKIPDARCRHLVQKRTGIVAVVDAVHDDVVDVEHEIAVGFFEHGERELEFTHRRVGRRIVGDVLECDALPENILYATYAAGDPAHGLRRKRDRQQVVEVSVVAAVTQVFGILTYAVSFHEVADGPHQVLVQGRRGADRQGQPVRDEGIALREKAELLPQAPADPDPVLRRHLHEVHLGRRILLQLPRDGTPQAKACAGYRILVLSDTHGRSRTRG